MKQIWGCVKDCYFVQIPESMETSMGIPPKPNLSFLPSFLGLSEQKTGPVCKTIIDDLLRLCTLII